MRGWVMAPESSDAELVTHAQSGDEEAVNGLITAYAPYIRAQSTSFAAYGIETDDLMQEGLLGLMGAVRHFRPENLVPFRAYAYICIKRRLVSAVRRATCGKSVPLNDAISLDDQTNAQFAVSKENTNPEEVVISQEAVGTLLTVVRAHLTSRERVVLHLYLSGFSYAGMAGILCVRVKAVDNILQRIRKRLRRSVVNI